MNDKMMEEHESGKFLLLQNQTVSFFFNDNLSCSNAFTKALQDLSADLTGVLNCSFPNEGAESKLTFLLTDGFPEEQYAYEASINNLYIKASSVLGLLWGIYDLAEKSLKVSPFRKFLGLPYRKLEQVQVASLPLSAKPLYRFRGWFFNDEDYITGWRQPAGKRPVDYLFYSNIMNHETVDEMIETALRNKLNLLIPSSFLDIDIKEDEENIRRITARGLYVSQHHIEPLGVSGFAFDAYFKRRNITQEPSYYSAPQAYDKIWRYYVKKWARYKNVIWQVGLRGKVDRPVWSDDPSIPNTEEFAGKLISEAIAHQMRIIKEETGDTMPLASMTLWAEGAALYEKGYLTIPENVIIVFADWPYTQHMREDFTRIERKSGLKYGMYHHTGSYCSGPHCAQGQSLARIQNVFRMSALKGDTEYVVSNVQNLRELVYGANAMAKLAFGGFEQSMERISLDWCNHMAPERAGELSALYDLFYDTYLENNWDKNSKDGVTYWFDGYIRLAGLFSIDKFLKNKWEVYFTPEQAAAYPLELECSYKRWSKTASDIADFCATLTGDVKSFVTDNLFVQASIMKILSAWAYQISLAIQADHMCNCKEAVVQAENAKVFSSTGIAIFIKILRSIFV